MEQRILDNVTKAIARTQTNRDRRVIREIETNHVLDMGEIRGPRMGDPFVMIVDNPDISLGFCGKEKYPGRKDNPPLNPKPEPGPSN